VLFYQLAFSAPLLWLGTLVFERGEPLVFRVDASLALLYQTVIVATVSYLLWFWLMRTQKVSSLHSFTFFTPLFGVIFGGLFLGEHLSLLLWLGLALVAGGTYLVNTRQR
jgi:drug/metabolite transporter (DMT)-like permease